MLLRKHSFRILVILLTLAAVGCSGERTFKDLDEFMANARARPGGKIEPMPVLKVHEVFKYSAMALRSPFDPPTSIVVKNTQGQSVVKPDANRPKQVLESRSFVSLSMVGSLDRQGVRSALITDGEGIHRVNVGHYLGKNYGRIVAIDEYRTDVTEVIPDGDGGWIERPRTLPLKENR